MEIIKKHKRNLSDCLIIVAALIIAGIITKNIWFFYSASALAIICGLIHKIAYFVSALWQILGQILGFIVSKIILTILFYFIVFPISLLQKLFSKNLPISNKKEQSYWKAKNNDEIDFTKPW